jgi:hypothetical protein
VQQWYVAAPLTPMPGIDGELPPEAEAAAAPLPDSGVPE